MRKILIPLLILMTAGCKDDAPESGLVGEWQWAQSSGGFAGVTYTPASTGETRTLVITADSLIFRTDGQRTLALKYRTVMQSSIYSTEETLQLETPGVVNFTVELDGDLILKDECFDCFVHRYTPKVGGIGQL